MLQENATRFINNSNVKNLGVPNCESFNNGKGYILIFFTVDVCLTFIYNFYNLKQFMQKLHILNTST